MHKEKKFNCTNCNKSYAGKLCLDKHSKKCTSKSSTWLPIFDFSDDYFANEPDDYNLGEVPYTDYLEGIVTFRTNHKTSFKLMLININSLFAKKQHLLEWMNLNIDCICLNETKLDETVPESFIIHNNYKLIRRDRELGGRHGGGVLIAIRKEYRIISTFKHSDIELIHIIFSNGQHQCNLINCYRPPNNKMQIDDFIRHLENFLLSIDLSIPLFITGDLNFNLLSPISGKPLSTFMDNYSFKNFVNKPTRVHNNNKDTLIDVILHNSDMVRETDIIGCPFSDHKLVIAALNFSCLKIGPQKYLSRCITESSIQRIDDLIQSSATVFNGIHLLSEPESKLAFFQDKLINILNKTCPEKSIQRKSKLKAPPWFDRQLTDAKETRDKLYKLAEKTPGAYSASWSKNCDNWNNYKIARNQFNKLNRQKMTEYFKNKKITDFRNNRKFWTFYKSSIKLKYDDTGVECPNVVSNENLTANTSSEIADLFNVYFTSIESSSLTSYITVCFSACFGIYH